MRIRRSIENSDGSPRAAAAEAAGFAWLVSHANEQSRPILERVGFQPIASRVEMLLRRAPATPGASGG